MSSKTSVTVAIALLHSGSYARPMRFRFLVGLVLTLGMGAAGFQKYFPSPRFEKPDHSIEATWIIFRVRSNVASTSEVEIWPVANPAKRETHPMSRTPLLSHAETVHWLEPDTEYAFRLRLIAGLRETETDVTVVRTKPKVKVSDVRVEPEPTQAVVTFRTEPDTICEASCRIGSDYQNIIWATDIQRVASHRLVLRPLKPDTQYTLTVRSKHGVPDVVEDETHGQHFRTKKL
jgi:hypothetical protein